MWTSKSKKERKKSDVFSSHLDCQIWSWDIQSGPPGCNEEAGFEHFSSRKTQPKGMIMCVSKGKLEDAAFFEREMYEYPEVSKESSLSLDNHIL